MAMEVIATHGYAHSLTYKYGVDKDKRILEKFKDKEKIENELGDYALTNTNEMVAEAFKYTVFKREYRPELANEIIDIVDERCLNKMGNV